MKQTPKEKAKELFDHYYILIQEIGGELAQEPLKSIIANVCASYKARCIISDLILDSAKSNREYYYWQEVEYEIESYEK
jgi:hypothetical protein